MIPSTISAVFFLIAITLGSIVLIAAEVMRHMQPHNKWRYVVYVASAALFVIAGLFLVEPGFYLDYSSK